MNPVLFRVPGPCRAAILDCRTMHGMVWVHQETFFESQPAREGSSSALFESSWNLASSSCGLGQGNTGNIMEHGRGVRLDPRSSPNHPPPPPPHVLQGFKDLCATLEEHILAMVRWINPRFPISEVLLRKFVGSLRFHSWKVNFKTVRCSVSSHHCALGQRS